jgi:hypothetical protein
MNHREAELVAEVEARRVDLVARLHALEATVRELDPREAIRRDPVAGILASIATGVILGSASPAPRFRQQTGERPGAGYPDPLGAPADLMLTILSSVLPFLLSRLNPPEKTP